MTKVKSYFMLQKLVTKGFTLFEALIALLVISGSLLVYQGLTKSTFANMNYLSQSDQDSWLLFANQFRAELEGSQFIEIKGKKMLVKKDEKVVSFRLTEKNDFRKSAASGKGLNPMLLNLQDIQMTTVNHQLTLHLIWQSGLERDFIYAFEKPS
ncbi:competence type IV pilus minor pilin ComGF [Streptococcus parauberis]